MAHKLCFKTHLSHAREGIQPGAGGTFMFGLFHKHIWQQLPKGKEEGWGERGTGALQTSPAEQGKGSLRAGRKCSPELALLIKPRSPGHWHRHTQALPSPSTSGHKLKMSTEARGRRQGLGRTKPCPSLLVSARAGGLAWPDRSKQAEVCLVFLRFSRLLSIDH